VDPFAPAPVDALMAAIIEATGLRKTFDSTTALCGLDLEVRRGRVTALLGPNGAGKSTFVGSVATLVLPDAGALRVAGVDALADPRRVRRSIGLAGQHASVEPTMTGRENLMMVGQLFGLDRRAAARATSSVLEQLGLTEMGDELVRSYSGGMRRRLDLGASLVGRPHLLLLDEPTTGLDPRGRIELWAAIRNLVDDGTDVLLTTQYLEDVEQVAHDIVIMDQGRVIASGTPDELKRRVGGAILEVRPRWPEDRAAVLDHLAGVSLEPPQADDDGRRLAAPVAEGPEGLLRVVAGLDASGVEVEDVALRRATLDEVFLRLTSEEAEVASSVAAPTGAWATSAGDDDGGLPAAVHEHAGAGFARTSWLAARRLLLLFLRSPIVFATRSLQCAAFMVMFYVAFGGAVDTHTPLSYIDFQVPGFLVTVVLWSGMSAAPAVAQDAELGFYDRMRSLPIPRSGVMAGRSLADGALLAWSLCTSAILGLALGFRPQGTPRDILAALVLMVVVGYASTWVFIAIGLVAGSAQAAQGLAALVVPLFFLSSANVPVDSMPGWVQAFAANQPISVVVNAVRGLVQGGGAITATGHSTTYWVGLSLVWSVGILAVFGWFCVWRFSRRP
jgi:ABC-2 type transport system ATP-binding protein